LPEAFEAGSPERGDMRDKRKRSFVFVQLAFANALAQLNDLKNNFFYNFSNVIHYLKYALFIH